MFGQRMPIVCLTPTMLMLTMLLHSPHNGIKPKRAATRSVIPGCSTTLQSAFFQELPVSSKDKSKSAHLQI